MSFTGLNPDAVAFYAELQANNSKEWWQANKARYAEVVLEPFRQLGEELAGEFGATKIFRPYRDLRFSADKTPYKTHIGMVTRETPSHYVQLSDDGLYIAGGAYEVPRPALERFRSLVDDIRTYGDVEATLEELAESGFEVITDGSLKSAPRGFTKDHPRIGLLRLTRLAVARPEAPAEWMWQPEAIEVIRDRWRTVSIWCEWLRENLDAELVGRDR